MLAAKSEEPRDESERIRAADEAELRSEKSYHKTKSNKVRVNQNKKHLNIAYIYRRLVSFESFREP